MAREAEKGIRAGCFIQFDTRGTEKVVHGVAEIDRKRCGQPEGSSDTVILPGKQGRFPALYWF